MFAPEAPFSFFVVFFLLITCLLIDRSIQFLLDSPVKPGNDDFKVFNCRSNNSDHHHYIRYQACLVQGESISYKPDFCFFFMRFLFSFHHIHGRIAEIIMSLTGIASSHMIMTYKNFVNIYTGGQYEKK
jgi:hypothetical protein